MDPHARDLLPMTVVFVNDNHCVVRDGRVAFEGSTFHRFLGGFHKIRPLLSSPCLQSGATGSRSPVVVDGTPVLIRRGYGTAKAFYAALPIMVLRAFADLYRHIRLADAVVLVLPACTAPVTFVLARLLRRPVLVYVVGDVDEAVETARAYGKVMRLAATLAARWEGVFTGFVARRCPTFALGEPLRCKLERAGAQPHAAMTSLLRRGDIRAPKPQGPLRTVRLVSVGRLSGEKGLDVALRAVAALVADGVDVTYTVVGEGPLGPALRDQARALGIQERVTFTGRLDMADIRDRIFAQADLFVLPSLSEGVPKVVLEAMGAGLPVVATAVGGVPELTGGEERGWLVTPGDSQSMRSSLLACAGAPEERSRRAQAAHAYIIEHTLEAEAGRIEELILRRCRRTAAGSRSETEDG